MNEEVKNDCKSPSTTTRVIGFDSPTIFYLPTTVSTKHIKDMTAEELFICKNKYGYDYLVQKSSQYIKTSFAEGERDMNDKHFSAFCKFMDIIDKKIQTIIEHG